MPQNLWFETISQRQTMALVNDCTHRLTFDLTMKTMRRLLLLLLLEYFLFSRRPFQIACIFYTCYFRNNISRAFTFRIVQWIITISRMNIWLIWRVCEWNECLRSLSHINTAVCGGQDTTDSFKKIANRHIRASIKHIKSRNKILDWQIQFIHASPNTLAHR